MNSAYTNCICHKDAFTSGTCLSHASKKKDSNSLANKGETITDIKNKIQTVKKHKEYLIIKATKKIKKIQERLSTDLSNLKTLKNKYDTQLMNLIKNPMPAQLLKLSHSITEEFSKPKSKNNATFKLIIALEKFASNQIWATVNKGTRYRILELPDNKFLAYTSNQYKSRIGTISCLFQIKKISKKAGFGNFDMNIDAVYFNGCVYVFGANYYGRGIQCRKYDLNEDRGEKLSANETAVTLKLIMVEFTNKIVYSVSNKMFMYDPFTDLHSSIAHFKEIWPGSASGISMLLAANQRIYMFEYGGNIFESHIYDPYNWTVFKVNSVIKIQILPRFCVRSGNTISMIFDDTKIYELNLKTKEESLSHGERSPTF